MSVAILITLLFGAAISLYFWIRSKYTYFEKRRILSKEPSFPYGNFTGVGSKFHISHVLKTSYEEYKNKAPVHGLYQFLLKPTFVVTDLDVIKEILIKHFDNFRNRGLYHNEDDVLSNHLVYIEDEPWKSMRNSLTSTFTSGKMKNMFHTVLEISNQLVDYVKKQGEIVEVKEVLARFTTDVIGNVAFGLESNSLKDPNSIFRQMGLKYFQRDGKRRFKTLAANSFQGIAKKLNVKLIPEDISEFFIETIRDTVEYRKSNKIVRNDFLDLIMKVRNNDKELSFHEITAQSFVFWVAGFETSSTTATFCLYLLSLYPDIQAKLRIEIETTLLEHNNEITYDAMMKMKYLQMVIDETLRLFGPAVSLTRKAEKEYKIPNSNLVIPEGATIFIPIHAIHNDPEYFPQPDKFDPERFSEENKKNRHPMTHIPFGDGPRSCIALRFGLMQTKISLIQLIRNFKFSPSPRTPIPMVLLPSAVVLTPRDDMHLKVEKL